MANTIIHPTRSEGAVVCSWLLRAGDDERSKDGLRHYISGPLLILLPSQYS